MYTFVSIRKYIFGIAGKHHLFLDRAKTLYGLQ